jgi:hypothetical protein
VREIEWTETAEPLARSLALAPVEEEQITPETVATLDGARASLARGEGIPHEEVLANSGWGSWVIPQASGSGASVCVGS